MDLPSRENQPFYHMLIDMQDAISAFGGQRSWRYVAQENLVPLGATGEGGTGSCSDANAHTIHSSQPHARARVARKTQVGKYHSRMVGFEMGG